MWTPRFLSPRRRLFVFALVPTGRAERSTKAVALSESAKSAEMKHLGEKKLHQPDQTRRTLNPHYFRIRKCENLCSYLCKSRYFRLDLFFLKNFSVSDRRARETFVSALLSSSTLRDIWRIKSVAGRPRWFVMSIIAQPCSSMSHQQLCVFTHCPRIAPISLFPVISAGCPDLDCWQHVALL